MARPFRTFAPIVALAAVSALTYISSGNSADASPHYMAVGNPWTKDAAPAEASGNQVYYSGCREARAAGAAPIYRGQPGYRPEMDGDDDGIACEPYHGN